MSEKIRIKTMIAVIGSIAMIMIGIAGVVALVRENTELAIAAGVSIIIMFFFTALFVDS